MNNNGIISAPINLNGDVCTVLGQQPSTLGTVCRSTKVNILSKIKPVKLNAQFPDRSSEWWRGANNNCGILLPITLSAPTGEDMAPWLYDNPTGDHNEPFRLADFNGYNHKAPSLFSMHASNIVKGQSFSCSIIQNANSEIKIKDIKDMYDGYIGLIVLAPNGELRFITAREQISQGGPEYLLSIDIPNDWPDGTYHIYMVVSQIIIWTVVTSIGTGIRSLNQNADNTGHVIREVKTPLPDNFRVHVGAEKGRIGYTISAYIDRVRGRFNVNQIYIRLFPDTPMEIIITNNIEDEVSTVLNTGDIYYFIKTAQAHVVNLGFTYLNYETTYQGSIVMGGSGSVWLTNP